MEKTKKVYSSRDIAKLVGVTAPTICKLCKEMGFELPLFPSEVEELKQYYRNKKSKKT